MLHLESRVLELLSNTGEENLYLLYLPPPSRHWTKRKPFQIFQELNQVCHPNLFLMPEKIFSLLVKNFTTSSMLLRNLASIRATTLTIRFSLGHRPTGNANRLIWMSSNPAALIHPSSLGPGSGSNPNPQRNVFSSLHHLSTAQPGLNSPLMV